MALDTYTNLQAAVVNWLKRDDLTSYIPDFVTLAEDMLFTDLAVLNPPPRQMETTQSSTLSGQTLALPAGYLSTKRFRVSVGGSYRVLEYKTPEQMGKYVSSESPWYYTTNGDNLELGPIPDSGYAYDWIYHKSPDPLATASGGVNWLLAQYPSLYLYGSLLQTAPFLKNDERLATWQALYQQQMQNLEEANRRDRISGSTLKIRSDAAVR